MHVATNLSNLQIMTPRQEPAKKLAGAISKQQTRYFDDAPQKSEHKPISKYSVSWLANSTLNAGAKLTRTVASFAFRQVMDSSYIGTAAPGLKESMLGLFMLYSQLKPTQATAHECESNQFPCESGDQCVLNQLKCDGEDHCADKSDEKPELCNANLTTTEEPILEFNATEGAMPEFRNTEDSESSSVSMGWVAVPVVLTAAAVAVGACAYKSYHVLRREDQESSKGQLIFQALKHPLYFREIQQSAASVEGIEEPRELEKLTINEIKKSLEHHPPTYKQQRRKHNRKSAQSQRAKKPFVKVNDPELSQHLLIRNIQLHQSITTSENTV